MTNVLIVLTLPEPVRMQYFNHVKQRFPGIKLDMVDHHTKVDPHIAAAEVLITFGPHVSNHVFEKAKNLKWVQALGTGVDGIADQPGLRRDVLLTNMHGFHGGPVSEAALMAMLSLARELPRSLRQQARRKWDRFPVKLLKGKTVGIFGVGTIAQELAPKCKALGMKVVGISSGKRQVPGFDAMHGREELEQTVKDWDYFVLLTPFTPETKNIVDAKIFAAMKPSSFFINLARGRGGRGRAPGSAQEQENRRRRPGRICQGAPARRFALLGHGKRHPHPAPGRVLRRLPGFRSSRGRAKPAQVPRRGLEGHDQCGKTLR